MLGDAFFSFLAVDPVKNLKGKIKRKGGWCGNLKLR
jgi:hypothetical protein